MIATPTAEIMKLHLNETKIHYNDMSCPIGSGRGSIIEHYPDWLEGHTLWKLNIREKSFRILRPTESYYDLAKASYLEMTPSYDDDTPLPSWTSHRLLSHNKSLSCIFSRKINDMIEEEERIIIEEEQENQDDDDDDEEVKEEEYVFFYGWLFPWYIFSGFFALF
jgi:hypothetical protein